MIQPITRLGSFCAMLRLGHAVSTLEASRHAWPDLCDIPMDSFWWTLLEVSSFRNLNSQNLNSSSVYVTLPGTQSYNTLLCHNSFAVGYNRNIDYGHAAYLNWSSLDICVFLFQACLINSCHFPKTLCISQKSWLGGSWNYDRISWKSRNPPTTISGKAGNLGKITGTV